MSTDHQHGDQLRTGANRAVGENTHPLLVFEATNQPRQLTFLGRARCVDEWTATAPDGDGRARRVLRFRLRFDRPPPARRATAPPEPGVPARKPRPFDPALAPGAAVPKGWKRSPEEILALQEKARRGHHGLLVSLDRWLRREGWRDIQEIEGAVDLWATPPRRKRRVIFEAKTVRSGSEAKRVRAAIAQLLEYRHFYGTGRDALCIVADRPLSDLRR